MAKMNKPLHVVVVPLSAHGHLIPALMLSHKLASVGFDVSYIIPEHRLEHLRKQAMLRGCHERVRLTCMKLNDPPTEVHQKCNMGHDSPELLQWVVSHSDAERDELVDLLRSFNQTSEDDPGPPICIISDNMKSWMQDVANELGIPRIVLCPSAVEALLMELYVKTLDADHRIPIRSSLRKENGISPDDLELFRLPGMPPIHPDDINSLILDTSWKSSIDFYVQNVLRIHEAAGIICSSFAELEPGACSAMQNREINPKLVPFLPVGPLLPDSYFAEPRSEAEKSLEWLDKQPTSSVLYISFGSVGTTSVEQVGELALGLEASGHPFLWVLREADEVLPEGFLSRVQGRCLVMQEFAPQLAVLSHRATGGFLTHSGWNSTVESISLGVPMISMPLFGDQRTICRMVVDRLKLGVELRKDGNGLVGREGVERAVKAVMDSEEGEAIQIRATRFKTVAREAFEASHGKLKAFVEQVTKVSKQ